MSYSLERFRQFKRSVVDAARAVSSITRGGDNKHIFLLETVTMHPTRTGGTGYTKTTPR